MDAQTRNALLWLIARELRIDAQLSANRRLSDEDISTKAENILEHGEPDPDPVSVLRAGLKRGNA